MRQDAPAPRRAIALACAEPVPERARAALAARFGSEAAAELAAALLLDAAEALLEAAPADAALLLYHQPADAAPRLRALGLGEPFRLLPQPPGPFPARVAHLVAHALADGQAEACAVVTTEAPQAIALQARATLPAVADELVLGPLVPAGVWALGLARSLPGLEQTPEGADLAPALAGLAAACGLRPRLLPPALPLATPAGLEQAAASGQLGRAPRTRAAYLRLLGGE
jgi:glycosyltransferase A (GT-A) superfamily protein (DUF2064 family)